MSARRCARCHRAYPEEEMLNLGYTDSRGAPAFSCEGCLLSFEQDRLYETDLRIAPGSFRVGCCAAPEGLT